MALITTAAHLKWLTFRHCYGNGDVNAFFALLADAPQLPALARLKLDGGKQVSPTIVPRLIARFQPTLESLWIQSVTVAEGGHIGDVLRQIAATSDWPALKCITVKTCAHVFFCPRLLFRHHQHGTEPSDSDEDGFEVTLGASRRKGRVNGVRYRGDGDGDGMRLTLSALGESAYTLRPLRGAEPDTPNMHGYSISGTRPWRVVQDLL
ncbi:hypothetical protein PG988_007761 [Apiospora saccharicola]